MTGIHTMIHLYITPIKITHSLEQLFLTCMIHMKDNSLFAIKLKERPGRRFLMKFIHYRMVIILIYHFIHIPVKIRRIHFYSDIHIIRMENGGYLNQYQIVKK